MPSKMQVLLHTSEDELFHGRCTDLSSGREDLVAMVEFGSEQAPVIRLGERTSLLFRGGGLVSSVETEGLALLRTDDQNRRCYAFRLDGVSKRSFPLLGSRRSARVNPKTAKPVRVTVLELPGDVPPEVEVHDISATGLSILVEPRLENHLCKRVLLRLSVLLPGDVDVIELAAVIRYRRLFGAALLYGLEIDGHGPASAQAQDRFLVFATKLWQQELVVPEQDAS
jgi:PilZ domain